VLKERKGHYLNSSSYNSSKLFDILAIYLVHSKMVSFVSVSLAYYFKLAMPTRRCPGNKYCHFKKNKWVRNEEVWL